MESLGRGLNAYCFGVLSAGFVGRLFIAVFHVHHQLTFVHLNANGLAMFGIVSTETKISFATYFLPCY